MLGAFEICCGDRSLVRVIDDAAPDYGCSVVVYATGRRW
ncbi:hypothetical protein ES702_06089 [subsurface metagenome]